MKYDPHFGFMLSYTSKPEEIQWSWDENYSQKTMEKKVLEENDNPVGLSNEHYKELYLKENPLVIIKCSLNLDQIPSLGSDSHY